MPITEAQCELIEYEEGTPGGTTFYITRGGREVPLCFRSLPGRIGLKCANHAGKGTWHVGTGACRKHGGNAGRPVTTGRNAHRARQRLKDQIDDYVEKDREELLSLDRQLAALKILFEEFVERFPEPGSDKFSIELTRMTQMIQACGALVEKISRIETRNAITVAQVLYLRATIADILLKYVPDDERERAVGELLQRLGGGNVKALMEG